MNKSPFSVKIFLAKGLQSAKTCQKFTSAVAAYENDIRNIFPLNNFSKAYESLPETLVQLKQLEIYYGKTVA